ncbi:hypothetical protein [Pedobacter sp. CFBP9032]|uniref:hypothetical protein n=1 Tax=Pedobacter sp. CFBP9032 TaxID=3096539 RepID=UPI002A69A6C2|nr:hypothetical protein [Pedobacter sp. CFBP9032]MDY0905209.1 hypothetical protein [Pedobacter sp. CFBP9032]
MTSIKLQQVSNYLDSRLNKLTKVIAFMEEVINSEKFKEQILGFQHNGENTFFYRKNIWGNYIDHVYKNSEVYEMVIMAKEEYGNVQNNVIDLYLELINGSDGSVIGFGRPEEKEVYTYSKMFDIMTIPELVNHYVHEWTHKIGFDHSYSRNAKRNYSVPYAVGNIAESVADGILNQH